MILLVRLTLVLLGPILLAAPAFGAALDARALPGDERQATVSVEQPATGAVLAETYVVVRPPLRGGATSHEVRLFIGVGSVVDDVRLGDGSLDVTFRDHWPIDQPGQPTRQRVRTFPLDPAWTAPAWAAPADLRP